MCENSLNPKASGTAFKLTGFGFDGSLLQSSIWKIYAPSLLSRWLTLWVEESTLFPNTFC